MYTQNIKASCLKMFRSEIIVRRCSVKKGVFKKFAKFTGKNLCRSLFCS